MAFIYLVIDSPVQGSEMDIDSIITDVLNRSNVSREILTVYGRLTMVCHIDLKIIGVVQFIKMAEVF